MPYTDNKSHIIKNAPDKICITLGGAFNNPVYINTNTKLDFIYSCFLADLTICEKTLVKKKG